MFPHPSRDECGHFIRKSTKMHPCAGGLMGKHLSPLFLPLQLCSLLQGMHVWRWERRECIYMLCFSKTHRSAPVPTARVTEPFHGSAKLQPTSPAFPIQPSLCWAWGNRASERASERESELALGQPLRIWKVCGFKLNGPLWKMVPFQHMTEASF